MIEEISNALSNYNPKLIDSNMKAAVLIPIINENENLFIIFEKRSNNLRRQPGEISFPGGKLNKKESYENAAIRETTEELRISKNNISIIGELDYIVTGNNSIIKSYVGMIENIKFKDINPNKKEVDHIFKIPLDYLIDYQPKTYKLNSEITYSIDFPYDLIPNGKDYEFDEYERKIYMYLYNNYVIWGYTASMLKSFIDILKNREA